MNIPKPGGSLRNPAPSSVDALDTVAFLTDQLRRVETQAYRLLVEVESLRKVAEICYERDSK